MTYVALEWDHKIGKFAIGWLVVKCASVGQKFGGPQALPPRKDIAYFVNPETAEMDAKSFAEYKNKADSTEQEQFVKINLSDAKRHAAFEWDHNIFNPLIKWAVLEWGGDFEKTGARDDIAYFLDADTAEMDAKSFSIMRNKRLFQ
ncbi:hypothetical protein Lbir_0144 [Legionella birminghamensis]|uniref:Uncharacterized protein n=1 Tax=Legionella birminghamensis TaxID=28083 RepID=A0A378ICK9_9GAMM|nr:hypothetical protein [Legionella birminghamensis]KTC76075.1 hypothetical protein Lbir_0144 [Legionella birminghamensis]STX32301.1 Uncharacterised protein [Legionella birminghamensis]